MNVSFCPWSRAPWWIRWTVVFYHWRIRGIADWTQQNWMTFHRVIYHPDNANPVGHPIVEHEMVHVHRQDEYGVWAWTFRYVTDWRFREQEEKPALLVDIQNGRLTTYKAVDYLKVLGVKTSRFQLTRWFEDQL